MPTAKGPVNPSEWYSSAPMSTIPWSRLSPSRSTALVIQSWFIPALMHAEKGNRRGLLPIDDSRLIREISISRRQRHGTTVIKITTIPVRSLFRGVVIENAVIEGSTVGPAANAIFIVPTTTSLVAR